MAYASKVRHKSLRGAHVLVGALASFSASCAEPVYDDVAFRCDPGATTVQCPDGFRCAAGTCVRQGVSVPTELTRAVLDDELAVSTTSIGGKLQVCWIQGPSSQQPGLFRSEITADGELTETATGIYTTRSDGSRGSVLFTGTCFESGGRSYAAVERPFGITSSYAQSVRIVSGDGAGTVLGDATLSVNDPHGFNVSRVGSQLWLSNLGNTSTVDIAVWLVAFEERHLTMPGLMVQSCPSALPKIDAAKPINGSEGFAAQNGAWIATTTRDGDLQLAWFDPLCPQASTRDAGWPAPREYLRGFALGTRGDELAVAVAGGANGGAGAWRVFWITPMAPDATMCRSAVDVTRCSQGTTGPATVGTQFMVRPGPTFTFDADLLRPGALVEGDTLRIAGARDRTSLVTLDLPWGGTTASEAPAQLRKISSTVPRRVLLRRVGTRLVAVWTEAVPESRSARLPAFTALYTAPFPER